MIQTPAFFSMPQGFKEETSFMNCFLFIRRRQRKEPFLYEQQNQNTEPYPGSILEIRPKWKQLKSQRAGIQNSFNITTPMKVIADFPDNSSPQLPRSGLCICL